MTVNERIGAGQRERRVLTRVSRAAWRLEQVGRKWARALALARAGGSRSAPWPRRPGGHPGAGLPELLRAVVLRRCEGTHRDAPVKR